MARDFRQNQIDLKPQRISETFHFEIEQAAETDSHVNIANQQFFSDNVKRRLLHAGYFENVTEKIEECQKRCLKIRSQFSLIEKENFFKKINRGLTIITLGFFPYYSSVSVVQKTSFDFEGKVTEINSKENLNSWYGIYFLPFAGIGEPNKEDSTAVLLLEQAVLRWFSEKK